MDNNTPIAKLGLPSRALNRVQWSLGVQTVGDLLAKSPRDILRARNVGRKTIQDIRSALDAHGLSLRGEGDDTDPTMLPPWDRGTLALRFLDNLLSQQDGSLRTASDLAAYCFRLADEMIALRPAPAPASPKEEKPHE